MITPPLWFCIFCRENIKNKSKASSWGLTLFMWASEKYSFRNLYSSQAFKAFSCRHLNLHFVRWNIRTRKQKASAFNKVCFYLIALNIKTEKAILKKLSHRENTQDACRRTSGPLVLVIAGASWIQVWFPTWAHLRDHATVSTSPGMAYTFQEGRRSGSQKQEPFPLLHFSYCC